MLVLYDIKRDVQYNNSKISSCHFAEIIKTKIANNTNVTNPIIWTKIEVSQPLLLNHTFIFFTVADVSSSPAYAGFNSSRKWEGLGAMF